MTIERHPSTAVLVAASRAWAHEVLGVSTPPSHAQAVHLARTVMRLAERAEALEDELLTTGGDRALNQKTVDGALDAQADAEKRLFAAKAKIKAWRDVATRCRDSAPGSVEELQAYSDLDQLLRDG